MILKVNFQDNDFCAVVELACNSIMNGIARGYKGQKVIELYNEARDRHGIENVRKAVVLTSYAYLVARRSSEVFRQIEYEDVYDQDFLIQYLNNHIEIEEIKNYKKANEDSSVCYIDFFKQCVYTQ